MNRIRLFIGIMFILLTTGCVLDLLDNEGIEWEYSLDNNLVAGLQQLGNDLIFADSEGAIFRLSKTSGLVWSRNIYTNTYYTDSTNVYLLFASETGISNNGKGLYAVVGNGTTVRLLKIDPDNPELVLKETNLNFIPSANYLVYEDNGEVLLLFSPTSGELIEIREDSDSFIINYHTTSISDIVNVLYDGTYFYVIGASGNIQKLLNNFNDSGLGVKSTLMNTHGSALIFDSKLFLGGYYSGSGQGVKTLDLNLDPSLSISENVEVDYAPLLIHPIASEKKIFIAFGESSEQKGIGSYSTDDLSQIWYYPNNFNGFTYCPIVYSAYYNLVAVIDDGSYLHIIDNTDGTSILQKYIGKMNVPYLNIVKDSSETMIYIPLNIPSKVIAYSLEYAKNQKP